MKVGAIIAEYNPFHLGHKYQIETIKKQYAIDRLIVIMSGDFTQRGEPAILGKELRTKHALISGADAVILLPVVYSTSGADLFAYGAVSVLNRLNVIDYLFFGSECGDINLLSSIAKESLNKDSEISALMKDGLTYAKARTNILSDNAMNVSKPNNILGIEYIKAIIQTGSSITPVTIKRTDDNYNNSEITNDLYASASSIRKLAGSENISDIIPYIPEYVYEDLRTNRCVTSDDFTDELMYALLTKESHLDDFLDISGDLMNRISANLPKYNSLSQFTDLIKSKNYTRSRISRGLLHILLNIKGSNNYYKEKLSELSHVRLLGFNSASSDLLSLIGQKSTVTLTSKVPDILNEASEFTKELFNYDLLASKIYSTKSLNSIEEYRRPVTIINL